MTHDLVLSESIEAWEKDFNNYKHLIQERNFYTETDCVDNLKKVYKKIYIYTTISNKIEHLQTRNKLKYFYNECRNNLIISFDLMNFNYISASKQILRSSIESFFRLTLSLEQIVYYEDRLKKNIYKADDILKDLKSLQESHKVGKLTSFTVTYFSEKSVGPIYNKLNILYSNLSSSVHVNKTQDFSPHKYLSDYNQLEQQAFQNSLAILEEVCELIVQALYYFSIYLDGDRVYFEKRILSSFENAIVFDNYLEDIDRGL